MDRLLVPVCFLIVLVVQLKIMRDIRTQTGLVMFYGKQTSKKSGRCFRAATRRRRLPDIPPDETGLYNVPEGIGQKAQTEQPCEGSY